MNHPAEGANEYSIAISALSKRYRPHAGSEPLLALDGIDLKVARGEFLSILGPSGCGKSTLLHVIAGLAEAEGDVVVHGRKVDGPGLDRGVVFQDYALFPWRTVLDNVAFGLEIKHVAAAEREDVARRHIAAVGLRGFEDRYPAQLSGGMKQRVAIARALAYDPEVLLMDEPFAALDAQTREILQGELLRIWERTGKTIVFVTHSLDEAVFLSQRVAVISARPGRLKAVVDIDLPAPRYEHDVRSSAEFAAVRHRLWELLADEVNKASSYGLESPVQAVPRRSPGVLSTLAGAFSRRAG
ncbi:ABC transporter ATP-binding protein [Pseudothauera rhizosphaerae]|uniref:ABC transporter ATP-binding protein n=1 Tax=Pseudothauera rhizosphaerae TaxID=2565932 RepID=A0A4S4APW0_9RHOO|nr:ABC transporter ATP-binding protein [Pseudothauera rhizosphaerae]THF60473.1 ABC transporter ATP-binding protein [Pseudothauera rhizosphaerae]